MDVYLRHISIDDKEAIEAEFAAIVDEILLRPEVYYDTPFLLVWDMRLSVQERTRALKNWRRQEEKRLRRTGNVSGLDSINGINQALTLLRIDGAQSKAPPQALKPTAELPAKGSLCQPRRASAKPRN